MSEAVKTVKVTIDNITVDVPMGTTILQAARMIGGDVVPPAMCYYSKLQVKVENSCNFEIIVLVNTFSICELSKVQLRLLEAEHFTDSNNLVSVHAILSQSTLCS